MVNQKYIDKLVELEMLDAASKHPDKFNSNAEAYAVIKEEIEEAWDEMIDIRQELEDLWFDVKHDEPIEDILRAIKISSRRAIQELIQVNAMARKAKYVRHVR